MSDTLRDRVLAAIRDADYHSCMYGEGIDAGHLADAVMEVLGDDGRGTCDASMVMNRGLAGTPTRFGPCILRHRHDGPGHKGANGAEWWPTTDPEAEDRTVVHSVAEAQLAASAAALARVQALADKIRDMPATGWITNRLDIALKLTPDPDPCERCKGHGVVPDWSNWNEAYGEPRPKPCPECEEAKTPEPPTTGGFYGALHKAVAGTVTHSPDSEAGEDDPKPLTVRAFGATTRPCESGRHRNHPGSTCEDYDADVAAWEASGWYQEWSRFAALPFGYTVTRDVPPVLRGPNYPQPQADPEPLRKVAEQALADGGAELEVQRYATGGILHGSLAVDEPGPNCLLSTPHSPEVKGLHEVVLAKFGVPAVRPFAELNVYADRVPEELAPDPGPVTPEGLYEQIMAVFGVPLPPYQPQPANPCPCGGGDIGGQRIHDPHCPMHPERLRAVQARLDAQLPESARAAGIHFEFKSDGEAQ